MVAHRIKAQDERQQTGESLEHPKLTTALLTSPARYARSVEDDGRTT